jgi:integrase
MRLPTTFRKEDDMQGKRTRVLDSRGRAVPGLYVRDGRFIAGYKRDGRWTMKTLSAETLTDARRERQSLLAGLREGRVAAPAKTTFNDVFAEYQEARSISERTRKHERHLRDRHLEDLLDRRVQDVSAGEVAKVLRGMRERYSPWTQVAVCRIVAGTFALAVRRGTITRNPMDGLTPSERPKQRNAKTISVLDAKAMEKLVAAGSSERWKAAIGLAGYAGLRLGEIRALTWADVDFDNNAVHVRRSLLPNGTSKAPKTQAGVRDVPMLPALRRALVAWKLRSPRTHTSHLVTCTATGRQVQERNLRRALEAAKTKAGFVESDVERLSWHSLRHSWASMLATDLELPATTLARLTGHADAGFTLRVYARDARDDSTVIKDVLARAAEGGIGG